MRRGTVGMVQHSVTYLALAFVIPYSLLCIFYASVATWLKSERCHLEALTRPPQTLLPEYDADAVKRT